MVTRSIVSASVIRRPLWYWGLMPSCSPIRVATFPPPCTRIFRSRIEAKSSRNDDRPVGSSITCPPILITQSRSIAPFQSPYDFTQYGLSGPRAIPRLKNDDRRIAIEHVVGDDEVASNGEAMHDLCLVCHH